MFITEKTLGDLAGWQALKAAKSFVTARAVDEARREGDVFRATVREGRRKYAVTLQVQGPARAEARCSCPEAQRGLICAHAVAAALATLVPDETGPSSSAPPAPAERTSGRAGDANQGSVATPARPASPAPGTSHGPPPGSIDVFIPAQRIGALASGAGRGQLPVFLQFEPGGDEVDPVAHWLAKQGAAVRSGPVSIDAASLPTFFAALQDHPRTWDGRPGTPPDQRAKITIAADGAGILELHACLETPDSVVFSLGVRLRPGSGQSSEAANFQRLSLGDAIWIWRGDEKILSPLPDAGSEVARLLEDCLEDTEAKATRRLQWLARNLDAVTRALSLETDEALSHLRLLPAEPRFIIHLDGSPRQASALVEAHVGAVGHTFRPAAEPRQLHDALRPADPYPIQSEDSPLTFFLRNEGAENRLRQTLARSGFSATADGAGWQLRGEREVAEFFAVGLPALQRRYDVRLSDLWAGAFRGWRRVAPVVRTHGAEGKGTGSPDRATAHGWLEMEFAYEGADGFQVPREELLRLLRSGRRTLRGPQGQTYAIESDSCEEFESLLEESGARLGPTGLVSMPPGNEHMLQPFSPPESPPLGRLKLPDAERVRERLGEIGRMLRPYQLDGVRWLIAAAESGQGALLADDMGLGKTLQSIALLRWLASCERGGGNCEQDAASTALVLCPTSLIQNWTVELQRFASELPVICIHKSADFVHSDIRNEFTVFLTSYRLFVRQFQEHLASSYRAVILDEASHIRNPETAVAKAVFGLRSQVRLALSGTPVENSVQDLWSIMRFVQPGLLGSQRDFNERYARPLAATGTSATDPETAAKTARRLRLRLEPFVLRRTKREVARELPDKIEKTVLCELSDRQKEVYRRLLEEGQHEIRDARRRNAGAARMTMFTVLLRLRQVCNDLRLLGIPFSTCGPLGVPGVSPATQPPDPAMPLGEAGAARDEIEAGEIHDTPGGKWSALADIVEEALGGDHKILLFSQFTGMLRLVRDWLDARSVGLSYLDGATRDRGAQVQAFQTDGEKRVFLISLKAGGYGLNLTAADHVILIDPWWNPAVEAQAIDRAHRIGQPNPVTASRLIARGTVEERILRLQESKRGLMAAAVEDDPLALPGLNDGELSDLLDL